MDVRIFNEQGDEVINQQGELVCCQPTPSMPLYFWQDKDGQRYQQAYFERFANVWTHGDYATLRQHGGLLIHGRSDTTLNPSGVRIGTAEIYQPLEGLPVIKDALAVGQYHQQRERIILFVQLVAQQQLTNELSQLIKDTIRTQASPLHVPAKIIQVPDIPKTRNGKVVELAVKRIVNQQPFTDNDTLANPESLTFFNHLMQEGLLD